MHEPGQFEQLLNAYVDGELSAQQRGQLDVHLRQDERLAERFRGFLSVEGLLRTRYTEGGPAGSEVLTAIRAAERQATGQAVLRRIDATQRGRLPAAASRARARQVRLPPAPHRGRSWWVTVAVAAVLLVLATVTIERIGRVKVGAPEPAAAVGWVARVVHVTGGAFATDGGGRRQLRGGEELGAGTRLETAADAGTVTIECRGGTRFGLGAAGALRLLSEAGTADRSAVFVERGLLSAEVGARAPDRALLASSPHVDVRVLGTRFSLRVGAESTRVDVERGCVHVTDRVRRTSTTLEPGRFAVAGARAHAAASPDYGGRATDGLLAFYTFEEDSGPHVYDNAWAEPALDLRIPERAPVRRLPGGGLALTSPALIASDGPATKIIDACRAANELTVEAWVRPAERQAEPAETGRIVTLSRDADFSNFRLEQGQSLGGFRVRLRTSQTNLSGTPGVSATPWPFDGQLVHLAYCRDARGQARFYLNGRNATRTKRGDADPERVVDHELVPGDFSAWADGLRLGLGNEFTGRRSWLGEYFLVAVYSRALREDEVRQNHAAGPPRRPTAEASAR